MMRVLVLMVFIFLIGCASQTAHIETPLTEVDNNLLALENMQGESFLHDTNGMKIVITNTPLRDSKNLGEAKSCLDFCEVRIKPELTGDDFKHVLYHEIGHCFGLGHSGILGDVMYSGYALGSGTGDEQVRKFSWDLKEIRK